jgi:membrane associated rhomboid family serine protease
MNAAVLSIWCTARVLGSENVIEWMMSNFMWPEDKQMRRNKPHTVVTSAFSHIDVDHFMSNMEALFTFAPDVILDLGCRRFAYFYIASCYASKFLGEVLFSRTSAFLRLLRRLVTFSQKCVNHVYYEKNGTLSVDSEGLIDEVIVEVTEEERLEEVRVNHELEEEKRRGLVSVKDQPRYSVGASGVLSAVISFHCLSFPHKTFPIGGTDLGAPLAALVWAINDLAALLHDSSSNVGHGAHLGGALFGLTMYVVRMAFNAQSRTNVWLWLRDLCHSHETRSKAWEAMKGGILKVMRSIDEN